MYDNNVYRGVGLWLNKCILYRPIYVRCVGTCISVYRPIVPNTRRLGGQTKAPRTKTLPDKRSVYKSSAGQKFRGHKLLFVVRGPW